MAHEAIRVHGFRAADLERAPALLEALDPLLAAMAGRVLVAHHARRGAGVSRRGAARYRPAAARPGDRHGGACTHLACGARRPAAAAATGRSAGSPALCGLPVHSPHTAIGDALTTAQLFVVAATQLDARSPQTVGRLARAQVRLADLERYWPRGAEGT